ncbi:MAG: TadE family protein [Acidimicrobiia bacterium]
MFLCTRPLSVVYGHGAAWEATAEHESTRLNFFDRGAALVELAFALPLVMMLILGMVSAGIAFNHQLALTHAAREGGRYAATLPVAPGTMDDWLGEIINQVIDDATGSLDDGVPGQYICVAYVHPAGEDATDKTTKRVKDNSGLGLAVTGEQCFVDDVHNHKDAQRRVQVEVRRETDFNVLFFSSTLTLDSQAVSRFEAAGGFG